MTCASLCPTLLPQAEDMLPRSGEQHIAATSTAPGSIVGKILFGGQQFDIHQEKKKELWVSMTTLNGRASRYPRFTEERGCESSGHTRKNIFPKPIISFPTLFFPSFWLPPLRNLLLIFFSLYPLQSCPNFKNFV